MEGHGSGLQHSPEQLWTAFNPGPPCHRQPISTAGCGLSSILPSLPQVSPESGVLKPGEMALVQSCCIWTLLVVLVFSAAAKGTTDNVITQWNAVAQQVTRRLGISNQISGKNYALVHLSQYKALQLAYKEKVKHPEAAAAYAAHYVLSELTPFLQSSLLDSALAKQIRPLKLSKEEVAAVRNIALAFAVPLVKERAYDGSQKWADFEPAPAGGPTGAYQFVPNQTYALYPQLATTRPFLIKSPKLYDHYGGPPKIPSGLYDVQYNTIVKLGDTNSPYQTQAERDTARFWDDGSNTSSVAGHLFNVTLAALETDISLNEAAKLFAAYAVATYDASIATFYQKYKYLSWRPITAVRQGDPSHKPAGFTALLAGSGYTPEYPSGHSTFGGAYAGVLSRFLGKSPSSKTKKPFSVATENANLPPRTFNTIEGPAQDIVLSRVYGGLHFPKSSEDAYHIGLEVGNYVWEHFSDVFGEL